MVGRLCRFFGGSIKEWNEMSVQESHQWIKVLEFLEAKEQKDAITISAFPHMKKKAQQDVMRAINKNLRKDVGERRPLKLSEVAEFLAKG